MKLRKTHRLFAWAVAAFLTFNAATGAFAAGTGSAPGDLGQTEEEAGAKESATVGPGGFSDLTETEAPSYPQLTAEDIVRLDEGDAEILFDDEGRATFIRGRYSPEKVENYEDAVESLNYVATLLGLTNGALFFCVYQGIDYNTGYTFYLFLQRDGDVTVVNAAIKIYVDPEGYTAALSCSFDPQIGVREDSEGKISAKEAEDVVRSTYPDRDLIVYEDATSQSGVMAQGINIHVWSVYTNNPDLGIGHSDQPFLQHFVTYNGEYLMNLPAGTVSSPLMDNDDALERRAKAMFEGYDPDVWEGEVTLHDGSKTRLKIPVARSREDGKYYLMDLDRKMVVADFNEAIYGSGEYILSSSDTNSGWDDRELLAMYNIGRAYDYYADHGLESVDGCGIPLMILSGVCEADGTPVDNAFFYGYEDGFGMFAISDVNDTVESLDIMAHEYTHGVTTSTMGGNSYVNEMGAINEAFSDIMGNLCELTYSINDLSIAAGRTTEPFEITGTSPFGSTEDQDPVIPDWRVGEMCGRTYRDMSNPVRCNQPAFVGDAFYCMPTDRSDCIGNDFGGVHENSSLLGSIAWVMNEHGLTYENQYSLWMTAMNLMTPKSDYDDILQALIFARKTYGFDEEIDTWLTEAFAQRGMLENSHSYSGIWDGMTFAEYHKDRLGSGTQQWGQIPDGPGMTPDLSGKESETQAQMDDLLGNLARQKEEDGSKTSGDEWMAGVVLDEEGRISREGYGRIELECSEKDREYVVGAILVNPSEVSIAAITCYDKDGIISFLAPEGNYWVWLCVKKGAQTVYYPYIKSGVYEEMTPYSVSGQVVLEDGEITTLPVTDII